jgi:predicted ATPase
MAVAEACEQLVERDLIRPAGADGYAFRHILIREVAYGTLPRSARALLHGAAGHWLEERASGREEAFAELVAYHFREAATLATALELDDAPALRAKALIWLRRAAEVALAAAATLASMFARQSTSPSRRICPSCTSCWAKWRSAGAPESTR